jgi:hypothetical protein
MNAILRKHRAVSYSIPAIPAGRNDREKDVS